MEADLSEVGRRARRRIALRLLPYLLLLYVICYVDRANVSFANLRMSADLGFSDRVYGFGVGTFFLGYLLFEVPGAIIVERWSARKWLARIMITWGLVTVITGFVHTARQFYLARLLLGVAEASFFPGVIVYLTHWFRSSDRAKAIAFFYAAVPAASVAGSVLASLLLEVHWRGIPGWRWIFILEGVPPIILGVVTIFYLTDWPRDYSIWQALHDRHVILLMFVYFCALNALFATTYFLPTFIKRLSGLPGPTVALLVAVPGLVGIAGMLLNGWYSDKTGERRWHTALPLVCGGAAYLMLSRATEHFTLVMAMLVLGGGLMFSFYPVFWSMSTTILSESAAAASIGLINSIGQLGGMAGTSMPAFSTTGHAA